MHGLQVRCEALVSVDDCVGRYVLLAVRLPEGAQLRPHVAPLVVRVLVARRHLLDRVDVDIDVRGRVGGVEHLAEGKDEAACGVLGIKKEKRGETHIEYLPTPQMILQPGRTILLSVQEMCSLHCILCQCKEHTAQTLCFFMT